MSISPRSRARRLQRLLPLKYYNVQKWESRLNLRIDAAENTHYTQKFFKLKLLIIEFRTKKSVGAYVYLPPEWSCLALYGIQCSATFYLKAYLWQLGRRAGRRAPN